MPITPVRGVGSSGIIQDTSAVLLPTTAWSDGRNVRFDNGSVSKIEGHQSILTTSVEPHTLIYWYDGDAYIYADSADIYKVDASNTSTEISQSGVTYNTSGVWHSSLFNGGYTVVMNNTQDTPQYIQGTGTNLADLTAWPSGYKAGVLRPFQNALIAGNITTSSAVQPGSILVSSQAAPGSIPASWTVGASLTDSADEFELSQTQPVIEIIDYRGTCFIFTGDSIHSLQLAQGATPTRVQNLNYGNGCLAIDCVKQFEGGLFVVDRNDIYVTTGAGDINSVANHKQRDYFFDNLNKSFADRTFVARNLAEDEMWVCFPNSDSDGDCNEALIWNYRDDTWTHRDLPNCRAAIVGPIPADGAFQANEEHLIFNGYRTSSASQEQQVTASGTESNQGAASQAAFTWDLSGTANVQQTGAPEVQTLTVSGSQANTPAVADVQTLTLSGRSNVIVPDQAAVKEIVEFGVPQNFDAGDNVKEKVDFAIDSDITTGVNVAEVIDFEIRSDYVATADTDFLQIEGPGFSDIEVDIAVGDDDEDTRTALKTALNADTDFTDDWTFTQDLTKAAEDSDAVEYASRHVEGDIFTGVAFGSWDIRTNTTLFGSQINYTSWNDWSDNYLALGISAFNLRYFDIDQIEITIGSATATFNIDSILDLGPTTFELGSIASQSGTPASDADSISVVLKIPARTVARYTAKVSEVKTSKVTSTIPGAGDYQVAKVFVQTEGNSVSSFSISNTDENIPAVTGNFSNSANATTARSNIKTALAADTEFTADWEHDEDLTVAAVTNNLEITIGGTFESFTTPTSGGYSFYIGGVKEGSSSFIVFINHSDTATTIDSIEDLIDYLVAGYNASTDADKIGTASKSGTDTMVINPGSTAWLESSGVTRLIGFASFDVGDFTNTTLRATLSETGETYQVTGFVIDGFSSSNPGQLGFRFASNYPDILKRDFTAPATTVARYVSKTNGPKSDFTFDITVGGGSNTYHSFLVNTGGSQVATFSINSDSSDITEITGSFTSGGDADQAITDLKTALNADSNFTGEFEFDEDETLAAVNASVDFQITEIPSISETDSAVTIGFGLDDGEGEVANFFQASISITASTTIENIVDAFIANNTKFDEGNFSTYSLSKQSADTLRMTSTAPEDNLFAVAYFSGYAQTDSDATGNLTFTVTDNNNSANSDSQTEEYPAPASYTQALLPFHSGHPAVEVTRYISLQDENFDNFTFTITQNDGDNTNPHLTVTQQGAVEIAGSGTATTYTLSDGGGSEVVSFTSSTSSADTSDITSVLSSLESGVDDNSETPIDYTGSVAGSVLTLTAAAGGASEGNWTLNINNNGITGDNAGTMSAVHAVSTEGADEMEVSVTYTITDEEGDTYDTTLTGAQTATQIAGAIRDLNLANWTSSGTGTNVVWTNDADGPVSTLISYSDAETNNSASVSGTVVETTAGLNDIIGSDFTLYEGDTLLSSGTFTSQADADTAGAFIAGRNSLNGEFSYDSTDDVLTFTYTADGVRDRPTLTINNPSPGTGNLGATETGDDEAGSDGTPIPSVYTLNLPSGFSPSSVVTEVSNETRSGVLEAIRDNINALTFTPVDINASVVGNDLILTWSGFNVATIFTTAVDNQSGDGDVTFGTPVENTITENSTELHAADLGNTFNGEVINAFVERKNFDMGDLEMTKWSSDVYPLMSGTGSVDVTLVGTNTAGKPVNFDDMGQMISFNIADDYKTSPRENGRFLNIKFESNDNDTWTLDGYSLKTEEGDRR